MATLVATLAWPLGACGPGGPTEPPDPEPVNIEGTWVGRVSQPGGGIPGGFRYRMILFQNNDRVTGTARAETLGTGSTYFAEWSVRGTVDGLGQFQFDERRITSQSPPPGYEWCLKSAVLQHFDGTPRRLTGDYSASPSPCLPGSIGLELR